jgi:hypothetical protein
VSAIKPVPVLTGFAVPSVDDGMIQRLPGFPIAGIVPLTGFPLILIECMVTGFLLGEPVCVG